MTTTDAGRAELRIGMSLTIFCCLSRGLFFLFVQVQPTRRNQTGRVARGSLSYSERPDSLMRSPMKAAAGVAPRPRSIFTSAQARSYALARM